MKRRNFLKAMLGAAGVAFGASAHAARVIEKPVVRGVTANSHTLRWPDNLVFDDPDVLTIKKLKDAQLLMERNNIPGPYHIHTKYGKSPLAEVLPDLQTLNKHFEDSLLVHRETGEETTYGDVLGRQLTATDIMQREKECYGRLNRLEGEMLKVLTPPDRKWFDLKS